jgi:hypothetical protein
VIMDQNSGGLELDGAGLRAQRRGDGVGVGYGGSMARSGVPFIWPEDGRGGGAVRGTADSEVRH